MHGDQASFELRGSSGALAQAQCDRSFCALGTRRGGSLGRLTSVDEQAAQREAGPDGRNGNPLREGVRAEGGDAVADAVGA